MPGGLEFQSGNLDQRARLDRLTELLESKTDVALLSRLVLVCDWQRLSADQQAGYEKLFGDVVLRNLARRLDQYAYGTAGPLDRHFRITGSLPAGKDDILVRSRVALLMGDTLRPSTWRAAHTAGRSAGDHRLDHRGGEPAGLAARSSRRSSSAATWTACSPICSGRARELAEPEL